MYTYKNVSPLLFCSCSNAIDFFLPAAPCIFKVPIRKPNKKKQWSTYDD